MSKSESGGKLPRFWVAFRMCVAGVVDGELSAWLHARSEADAVFRATRWASFVTNQHLELKGVVRK